MDSHSYINVPEKPIHNDTDSNLYKNVHDENPYKNNMDSHSYKYVHDKNPK